MRQIRWMRWAMPGLLLGTGLALGACDNGSSSGETPPAPSASAAAPVASAAPTASTAPVASAQETTAADEAMDDELRDYHRRHHHGGVTMFISMAIDTLGLDPAKTQQVSKIQSDLQAKMAPAREAERDLHGAIADGVAAGKIDTTRVDAAVAKVGSLSASIDAATVDSLTQLHDALSPVERAALVDKVKAHGEVWHKVNTDEKAGSTEKGTPLARLTVLLTLTPDQVSKIADALSAEVPATPKNDPKPVDAQIQAFGAAFVADKFDPKSLGPTATAAAGHIARHGAARLARFYEAVTPVLTADQRTKLAADLHERLNDQYAAAAK